MSIIGILKKDQYLQKIEPVFFLIYGGAILIQYVFIEILPVKIIAVIDPVRFSIFAFWMLVFVTTYTLSQYLPLKLIPVIQERKIFARKTMVFIMLAAVSLLYITGLQHKDNPKEDFTNQHPELVQWIELHTTSEDVFSVFPSFPPTHVPLLLNRGVFTGNGFPFTEDSFVEFNQRERLIFGSESYKNDNSVVLPGGKHTLFYRALTPDDFVAASKEFQLDYVATETKHVEKFSGYSPVYADEFTTIYALEDLIKNQHD